MEILQLEVQYKFKNKQTKIQQQQNNSITEPLSKPVDQNLIHYFFFDLMELKLMVFLSQWAMTNRCHAPRSFVLISEYVNFTNLSIFKASFEVVSFDSFLDGQFWKGGETQLR